ncbi:MAG: hypothetical protein KAS32_18105 [Candidatus Peribacteraceae bacterium]|nr:hypothetical protein [Candidatus Peribacteraceae bacterium]
MSVDFFIGTCQEQPTKKSSFGICDDQNQAKAYLDFSNQAKWVAEVENPNHESIVFTAIDNCIDLLRPNGKSDYRCDGILTYQDNIIFVELKERKVKNYVWIRHAEKQVRSTISHFKANHDINEYSGKRAYLANNKKPYAHSFQGVRIRQFKQDTGFILYIMNEIEV